MKHSPTPDRPKHAPTLDLRRRHPGVQRLHRPASQIDDIVLLAAVGFRSAEMNGKRGEGAPALDRDRRLYGQLFSSQTGDLTAPAAARTQRRPLGSPGRADRAGCRSRSSPAVLPARHRDCLGALATPHTGDSANRKADGGLEGRGGEDTVEAAPFGQRRPVRQPPAHRRWRVRTDGFEKPLAPEVFRRGGRMP